MLYNVLMSRLSNFCTIHFLNTGLGERDNKQFVEVGALVHKLKKLQKEFPNEKADKLAQKAILQLVLEN